LVAVAASHDDLIRRLRDMQHDTTCQKNVIGWSAHCDCWVGKTSTLVADALRDLRAEREALRKLVAKGVAVVEDFMPNIGNCALQDYGRLNEFLIESAALAAQERKP
jgi:hypothetical protein